MDRDVLADADVDRGGVVVALQQGDARARPGRRPTGTRGAGYRFPTARPTGRRSRLASANLRTSAGRTWEVSGSKLSFEPYRFVGIAEMNDDAVLAAQRLDLQDAGDLGDGVGVVGRLERPGEQAVLADRLVGVLGVDAARPEEQQTAGRRCAPRRPAR